MVVSHARDFLNVVCTDILHLHSRKLTSYKGDFDTFERTATERLRNAKKAAEGQERQRAHMQVWCFPGNFSFFCERLLVKCLGQVLLVKPFWSKPLVQSLLVDAFCSKLFGQGLCSAVILCFLTKFSMWSGCQQESACLLHVAKAGSKS